MSAEVKERFIEETQESKNATLRAILCDVRLLLIGLWLGAAVFFSFAVAPSVFAVLPSREMAGAVVQRTLMIINVSGFAIGLLLLISAFVFRGGVKKFAFICETVSLFLLVVMTGIGQWVIAANLQALRAQMTRPIDELAQTDPLRVAFNSLHGYSVTVLSVGMIAAILAFLLIARRRQA